MEKIINDFGGFIFWFVPIVVLFLVLREVILWYWKINQTASSLDRIANSLEVIALNYKEPVIDSISEPSETVSIDLNNNETTEELFTKKSI